MLSKAVHVNPSVLTPRPCSRYLTGMSRFSRFALCALLAVSLPAVAAAHPHMWIDATFDLEFDANGIASLAVAWEFDEFNSAELIFGFDDNLDGAFSRTEVDRVRREAFEHLVRIDYFLVAFAGQRRLEVPEADHFSASIADGRLRYEFTLPMPIRWREMDDLVLGTFDESYFIDFVSDARRPSYETGARSVRLGEELLQLASDGWGTVRVPALRVEIE
jgi:nickel/cobalt transporter (NicO) family protein